MTSHFKPQINLTLYRGFQGSSTYVWSPFVTKLEARLRFAGLSYRNEAGSPFSAPRGKLPYVAISKPDSANPPTTMGDSTLIVRKLVEDGVVEDLNAKLDPVEKAHDLALRALLEDRLYWYQGYERWHQNYYTMRPHVLQALPYPVQLVVGLLAYRENMKRLYGQGTGRFSAEEIASFRQEVWESFDALLAASRRKAKKNDTFWVLGGEGPSEADAVVFGFIAAVLVCKAAPESQKVVRALPAVVDYARRIHEQYFPDYECWE